MTKQKIETPEITPRMKGINYIIEIYNKTDNQMLKDALRKSSEEINLIKYNESENKLEINKKYYEIEMNKTEKEIQNDIELYQELKEFIEVYNKYKNNKLIKKALDDKLEKNYDKYFEWTINNLRINFNYICE